MNSKPKHMHPLAIVQQSLAVAWVPFLKAVFRGEDTLVQTIGTALLIWLIMIIIVALPAYFSTTYQLTDDALILRRGIFKRSVVQVNYARIQTVQHKQWFFLKPFALTSIMVETAAHAGDEPEVKLDCVPVSLISEIERRQAAWRQAGDANGLLNADEAKFARDTAMPLWHASLDDRGLWAYALTSLSFLPLFLIVLGIWKLADSLDVTHGWVARIIHAGLALRGWPLLATLVGGLVLALLVGIGLTVLRYWHYDASFDGAHLRVTKGLLQLTNASAETERIQLLSYEQNVLRRCLGKGTTLAILAAGGSDDDADSSSLTLLPLTARAQVWQQLRPLAKWLPEQMPAQTHFTTGTFALVRNAVLLSLCVIVPALIWLRPLGYVLLLLLLLAVSFGLFAGKTRALGITDDLVYVSTGATLGRTDRVFTAEHVQSLALKQSWWMTRSHLVHIVWHLRMGNGDLEVELRYVPEQVGRDVYAWYQDHL
ncbi:PH domain-containing protein [Lacticaseibacillus songhuajiangensis]|jgi:putative membrane protein|uniref:PH domain-containing protein n=1 Tax=Lacticaseibacillus songhuajiangensis TaxID=1296539 RepID=UPI000F77C885|nr:PH domain-containing protein [Lacticaseibacillus songhuajiangensis]